MKISACTIKSSRPCFPSPGSAGLRSRGRLRSWSPAAGLCVATCESRERICAMQAGIAAALEPLDALQVARIVGVDLDQLLERAARAGDIAGLQIHVEQPRQRIEIFRLAVQVRIGRGRELGQAQRARIGLDQFIEVRREVVLALAPQPSRAGSRRAAATPRLSRFASKIEAGQFEKLCRRCRLFRRKPPEQFPRAVQFPAAHQSLAESAQECRVHLARRPRLEQLRRRRRVAAPQQRLRIEQRRAALAGESACARASNSSADSESPDASVSCAARKKARAAAAFFPTRLASSPTANCRAAFSGSSCAARSRQSSAGSSRPRARNNSEACVNCSMASSDRFCFCSRMA